jgi:hypothetical protein
MTTYQAPPAIAEGLPVPEDAPMIMAQAWRQGQALLGALLIRDVISLWQQMNPYAIRASWPAVRSVISGMVQEQWLSSALGGTDYYERARAIAIAAGEIGEAAAPFAPSVPEVPEVPFIGDVLDMTGPWTMLQGISGGQQVQAAMSSAAVSLSGAAARIALGGGRGAILEAVSEDPQAVAWMRVLGPRPCAFCAMLASRGAVYKTEQSADFDAHNHCMCTVAPAFSKNQVARLFDNELYRQWKEVTRGYKGKDAINAWRRYWRSRDNSGTGTGTEKEMAA